MRTSVAAMVVAFTVLFAGCSGASPSATGTDPTASRTHPTGSPATVDAAALVARLAPSASHLRTDLEAIHFLNTAITTGADKDPGALFGELVDMIRNRFPKDLASFEAELADAAAPERRYFAESLAGLRDLESRGQPVTGVASPSAEQIQVFLHAVDTATDAWNSDVASLWKKVPGAASPLADPACGPDSHSHCHGWPGD
jgi:hypothetical protein